MNTSLNMLLFGLYPYIAIVICIAVSIIRFDREQYTWKAGSSQLLRGKGMVLASNLFHIGIIFILAGHFVGLLTPESIYHHVISTPNKQLLAMVSGGFFGGLCFIGLTMLLYRRLTDARIKANTSFSDIFILLLLYIQLILGLSTIVVSASHMDGSIMIMLSEWAQNIVLLRPVVASESIANVHILYKLHVFFGLSLILVFPYTRLVHMISAPIWYLGRSYQIVRQKN
ncbi:MAG: respiratory nitrate reductase subunit gamma [Pseudomonadales bacterium]|nr:respiratory nitrate reductase subunit gamma [Pseudomonadales bacterium]